MRTRKSLQSTFTASLLYMSTFALSIGHAANSDDPPNRVARISYLQGDVSLKPAGSDDWALTSLNRPLTTDDQLSLDSNARAELQVGSATIHLNQRTAFSFSELSDAVLQARLTDGAIHLTVRRIQKDEVIEIDTPQAAITITKPGDYRIEIQNNGTQTLVKTYNGECEVAGNRAPAQLQSREQITLDESGADITRESFTPRDEFDRWAQARNERFSHATSARYVAPDVIGYEDLDGYGEWTSEADYGYVWYPRIAIGWSPYRDGHWAWVSPWGWTWVDNAPWGFAPFHYGRWAHVHNRWGWVPGPMHVHAVYAPALVAWVGGPNFNVSVSFGTHVGWFPLAPREVYVPGYHCSPRHIHNVNYANTVIVNNTIINRAYVNRATSIEYRHRNNHNAITVVSRDTFVSARPVSNHRVSNHTGEWQTRNSAPAITPERASALGSRWNDSALRTSTRGNLNVMRDVITRHAPPPTRPSFEHEQRAIRDNSNRPIPRSDLWGNRRTDTAPMSHDNLPPLNNSRLRNDRSRQIFDRAQEEMRPIPLPQGEHRSRSAPREPVFGAPRAESPRRVEPPQREQRSEPAHRSAPPEQRTEQRESHFRGRENRSAVER